VLAAVHQLIRLPNYLHVLLRHRLIRQPGIAQRLLAIAVETELTDAITVQPAQQRQALLNVDSAALSATVLVRAR
jgi:hypothetical protein